MLLVLTVALYGGVRLAGSAPALVHGPQITLAPSALPLYAVLSTARVLAAYVLSLLFTLVYGYAAANNRRASVVLLPLLDVLQSVPILSFLPVVLLSLSAVLPLGVALELAAIVLIFTSQVWNMTFSWYQSLTTIPHELREASSTFGFNNWLRFKTLDLPFGTIGLIWNSMMSLAGGWFFVMAAEIFTVGERDFRLPGLGSYLQAAANQGDMRAVIMGVAALIFIIVLFDHFLWRPLLAWSDHYRLEMSERDNPPTSWWYDTLQSSRLAQWCSRRLFVPVTEALDSWLIRRFPPPGPSQGIAPAQAVGVYLIGGVAVVGLLWGVVSSVHLLSHLSLLEWQGIAVGVLATLLRVVLALALAFAWTIPVGVAIGTNQRLANWLQPLVQIIASVPATALFPVVLLLLLALPGGLNIAAVLLMLLGTQWYLLFNVIAGASAIPQDLSYTAALIGLKSWDKWRTLILPALFPYLITGAITAGGGAWNASIVAEYTKFGGKTYITTGVGSSIAQATAAGNYPLLLAATLSMVVTVVLINRLVWRRLYQLAEKQYRME